MSDHDRQRILRLQKKVSIARVALEKIKDSWGHPASIAEDALERMDQVVDKPTQLQGLVGG